VKENVVNSAISKKLHILITKCKPEAFLDIASRRSFRKHNIEQKDMGSVRHLTGIQKITDSREADKFDSIFQTLRANLLDKFASI